jgi:hypothetical protein
VDFFLKNIFPTIDYKMNREKSNYSTYDKKYKELLYKSKLLTYLNLLDEIRNKKRKELDDFIKDFYKHSDASDIDVYNSHTRKVNGFLKIITLYEKNIKDIYDIII